MFLSHHSISASGPQRSIGLRKSITGHDFTGVIAERSTRLSPGPYAAIASYALGANGGHGNIGETSFRAPRLLLYEDGKDYPGMLRNECGVGGSGVGLIARRRTMFRPVALLFLARLLAWLEKTTASIWGFLSRLSLPHCRRLSVQRPKRPRLETMRFEIDACV